MKLKANLANMPLERLEKKIGDLASPSLNNGSGHDPLNDIANVRNKFNNLKFSRDCLKEVTLLEAEKMKLGNPSKEEEYILTLEEKKKTFIPKSVVCTWKWRP